VALGETNLGKQVRTLLQETMLLVTNSLGIVLRKIN
jgi:hypothetical protein